MNRILRNRNCSSVHAFELLEARLLWTGDVSAVLKNGSLSITGDDADNQVVITEPVAGTFRVAGVGDTTVNGSALVDFSNVNGNLKIRMQQGGTDETQVQGAINILGNVDAKIGDGTLVIEGTNGGVDIAGKLKARGDGDIALRNGVVVHGSTSIKAGGAATATATPGILPDFASATFSHPLTIDNPHFPLVPGSVYTYEDISSDEDTGGLDIEADVFTVTNNTRVVDGITIRDIHDQAFDNQGRLIEDTIDFHAQDDNGNVWYLGEDTTSFQYDAQGNQISSSKEGSWEAGVNGARPGVIMLADPTVGASYFQEISPNTVLDQGLVLATGETTNVPAGTFTDVVHTKETSVLEPEDIEQKFYAAGLGSVQERTFDVRTGVPTGIVRLFSVTLNGSPVTQVVSPNPSGGTNVTGTMTGNVQFMGKASIKSTDTAVLAGSAFAGTTKITSKSDLAARDSTFSGRLTVHATDTVGFNSNVTVAGQSDIRTADFFTFGSTFNGAANVQLGNADDEFVAQDSTFSSLTANGRGGEDTFDDRGGNTFGSLTRTSFEVLTNT